MNLTLNINCCTKPKLNNFCILLLLERFHGISLFGLELFGIVKSFIFLDTVTVGKLIHPQ